MNLPTDRDDMIHRIAAALLPALLGAAPLAAQDKATSYPVEKHLNLAYNMAKDADPVRHKLDLYVPKGAKDFPVMVFVHGGMWRSGNKELYALLGDTFAKQGIGTAVINYRLSNRNGTGVKHPEHVRDVAKAFAWVKANAAKYGGSKDKLYLSGHSAGGHLVSLLATDEQYLKAEGCSVADIKGVMTVSGVYTVSNLVPAFHDIFSKDDAVCQAASPITHVTAAKGPPFLIAYGTKDFPFLDQMAEQFGKKLADCKRDAKVLKLDRDHFSIIIRLAASPDDELTRAMVEFMKK
jgi:acetyl esterase/lipase